MNEITEKDIFKADPAFATHIRKLRKNAKLFPIQLSSRAERMERGEERQEREHHDQVQHSWLDING